MPAISGRCNHYRAHGALPHRAHGALPHRAHGALPHRAHGALPQNLLVWERATPAILPRQVA